MIIHPARWLALALFALPPAASAATLREQLALAREDGQRHSQIEILRRILAEEPEDAALREALIRLWLDTAAYDRAEADLAAWADAPAEFRALASARILSQGHDDTPAAIALLREFLASNPQSLAATRELAARLHGPDRRGELVALLSQSPLTPRDAELLLSRAQARRDDGDIAAALADFAAAKTLAPDHDETTRQAPSFERLAQAAPLLSENKNTLRASPKSLPALVSQSYWSLYANLPPEQAQDFAARALAAHPASAAARLAAARASRASSQETLKKWGVSSSAPEIDSAALAQLAALDEKIENAPSSADARLRRAVFLNATAQQFALAQADAEAALDLSPRSADARREQLTALCQLGREKEAAAAFLALEALKPGQRAISRARLIQANAAFNASRLEQALDFANRSLDARSSPEAFRLRAAIFQRLGRADEARADLEHAGQSR